MPPELGFEHHLGGGQVRVPIGEVEIVGPHLSHLSFGQVQDRGGDETVPGLGAEAPRVLPHRATDRPGDADEELQPGNTRVDAGPGHLGQRSGPPSGDEGPIHLHPREAGPEPDDQAREPGVGDHQVGAPPQHQDR